MRIQVLHPRSAQIAAVMRAIGLLKTLDYPVPVDLAANAGEFGLMVEAIPPMIVDVGDSSIPGLLGYYLKLVGWSEDEIYAVVDEIFGPEGQDLEEESK